MNILNKLTFKNLMYNKKRTIVSLIGIILSVALICAITTFVSSFQNSLIEDAKRTYGDYHIMFNSIASKDKDYILINPEVETSGITKNIGYARISDITNKYKPYIYIKEFDEKSLEMLSIKLKKGRFPENSNEIVIPEHLISDGEANIQIGDKIRLDVGKRTVTLKESNKKEFSYLTSDKSEENKYQLSQNNPYFKEEVLEKEFEKEYEVVGIINSLNIEDYSSPGYTVISKLDNIQSKEDIDIIVKLYDQNKAYDLVGNFDTNILTNSNKEEISISANKNLLKFSGIVANESTMETLTVLSTIVICIIMITSIFVIKNSFDISITERLKQYGMLRSVGATSKQVKRNVMFEGIILGIVAIPLGIIFGIGAIYITLLFVNGILANIREDFNIDFYVSYVSIIISVIVSIITIFISSIIPAIKASKISPLDAIRSTKDIRITNRKLKTSKIFNKIIGIEGKIAKKNLKRSKKKYRTTIFSIFLSIVLFISVSSFIKYAFKVSDNYYTAMDYNVIIYNNKTVRNEETIKNISKYYGKVTRLNNADRYSIEKYKTVNIDAKKYISKDVMNLTDEQDTVQIQLVAVGDKEYKNYIKELGLKYEDIVGKGILIDTTIINVDEKRVEVNYLNVSEKEYIEFDMNELKDSIIPNIQIAKRTDKLPIGIRNGINLIVSDKYMDNFDYNMGNMYIQSEKADTLVEDIKKVDENYDVDVVNVNETAKRENSMVLIVYIFAYGFIGVISVIGITNVFNTITTNMALRNGEFAILKSVGMTNKQFKKMINYESILYGIKALLYGIPVGLLISYLMYNTLSNSYEYSYVFPIKEILISIVFVFAIIFITMKYSMKKAENKNIIETIRNENI